MPKRIRTGEVLELAPRPMLSVFELIGSAGEWLTKGAMLSRWLSTESDFAHKMESRSNRWCGSLHLEKHFGQLRSLAHYPIRVKPDPMSDTLCHFTGPTNDGLHYDDDSDNATMPSLVGASSDSDSGDDLVEVD